MSSLTGSAFFCISFQFKKEQADIVMSSIFNTKPTSKINKLKYILFKYKLNQVLVIALLDQQLLHQIFENAILRRIIYWHLENYFIFTS